MICPVCNGTQKRVGITARGQSNKLITVTIPCWCFVSKLVSDENKLLRYIGEQFMDLDSVDKNFVFFPENLSKTTNLIIQGVGKLSDDTFLLMMKSVMMKYRFHELKPRILLTRSIDIFHDYHVQQDDGTSLHLSSLSIYDLIIVKFGTQEMNKALAPCLAQLVQNRLEEKKPIWIYHPEIYTVKKEYSAELEKMLDRFKKIELHAGESIKETRQVNDSLAQGIYG